jgi:hypothetical protein
MNQLGGLGQAEIVAAILGPVVSGGADIYRTHEESKLSKEELEQRQKEFEAMSKLQQRQLEAAQRAQLLQQHQAMQQQVLRQAWWQRNLPLIAGGTVVVALLIAAGIRRRR